MFNYHELMMGQPRDTPAQRRQYLVICVLGFGVFLSSAINAGMFHPVYVSEGAFPGGEFIYQLRAKDYASSMGLLRRVAVDLDLKNEEWGDLLYGVYLDEEGLVGGGKTRYMGGALLGSGGPSRRTSQEEAKMRNSLESCSSNVVEMSESEIKIHYGDGVDAHAGPYDSGRLPKVKAAVVQFPFTNGFISCLVHSYKVMPALIKYVKKNGGDGHHPITLTTCSVKQQMCTHFAPLDQSEKFLLGKPDTATYVNQLKKDRGQPSISMGNVMKGLKKLSPF